MNIVDVDEIFASYQYMLSRCVGYM